MTRSHSVPLSSPRGGQKKGPLADASGPSLGRKRPRRAAVSLPHCNKLHRSAPKSRAKDENLMHSVHISETGNAAVDGAHDVNSSSIVSKIGAIHIGRQKIG